ncbi:MAG: hypothetical protein KF886_00990 [Candidatus Hydrogenedentes bacterium]|nr:hypothetical protein [Candidatus Hydrogenedentota bacterium]
MMNSAVYDGRRHAVEIRQQLNELLEIKQALCEGGDFGFAGQANLESIVAHEAELREELRAAELYDGNASADFVLAGEPLRGHEIPAQLLGVFLEKLQALSYAVGQARMGSTTKRARVPKEVSTANRLYVQPSFVEGSFGFRVKVSDVKADDQVLESNPEEALQAVCLLLGDDEPSVESLDLLSHSRVKSHYTAIIDLLAKQNVGLSMRHKDRNETMRLSPHQARHRAEWLAQVQVRQETIDRYGELVGGNIEQERFELRTGDELIRGTLSNQAKKDLKTFHWGESVLATLLVTQSEHEDAISASESYVAVRFANAEE